jgi:hypothetical protein
VAAGEVAQKRCRGLKKDAHRRLPFWSGSGMFPPIFRYRVLIAMKTRQG